MTRYTHLSHTEHILSLTDYEVKYIKGLLQRGPLQRTKKSEEMHDMLLESCNSLLHGKQH